NELPTPKAADQVMPGLSADRRSRNLPRGAGSFDPEDGTVAFVQLEIEALLLDQTGALGAPGRGLSARRRGTGRGMDERAKPDFRRECVQIPDPALDVDVAAPMYSLRRRGH